MIQSIGQVMVYVDDVEAAVQFWTEQVGFEQVERQENGGQLSYRIAPKKDSEVSLVLHDRAVVAQMNPEVNLGTPSILFSTDALEQTYAHLVERGVKIHPIMDVGFMRVCSFSDLEGNYFALREVH